MGEGRINYSVVPDYEELFLEEFSDSWTDDQLNYVTSGFRSAGDTDVGSLPDPDTVDPKKDPVTARKILQNPASSFNIGERPFVLPLMSYLEEAKEKIAPEVKVLSKQMDFYLIKYSVDAKPNGKEKFTTVEMKLDYPDDGGFLTYNMIPDTELEELLSLRAGAVVGINAGLKFAIPDEIEAVGIPVSGSVEASTDSNLMVSWEYKALKARVVSVGRNSSHVEWTIENPERFVGNIEFSVVICGQRGVRELPIKVSGNYRLDRGILWWRRGTTVRFASDDAIVVALPE